MRIVFLFISLIYSAFVMSQNGILVPPENIRTAFANEYPNKTAIWSIEYGAKEGDIRFEAQFYITGKVKRYALFDSNGVFKYYREEILSSKLPKNTIEYLDKNYPLQQDVAKTKTKSKSKYNSKSKPKLQNTKPLREAYYIEDNNCVITYSVKVKKEAENYRLIFDEEGDLIKIIKTK